MRSEMATGSKIEVPSYRERIDRWSEYQEFWKQSFLAFEDYLKTTKMFLYKSGEVKPRHFHVQKCR